MIDYQKLYSMLLGDISDFIDKLNPITTEGKVVKRELLELCNRAEERVLQGE